MFASPPVWEERETLPVDKYRDDEEITMKKMKVDVTLPSSPTDTPSSHTSMHNSMTSYGPTQNRKTVTRPSVPLKMEDTLLPSTGYRFVQNWKTVTRSSDFYLSDNRKKRDSFEKKSSCRSVNYRNRRPYPIQVHHPKEYYLTSSSTYSSPALSTSSSTYQREGYLFTSPYPLQSSTLSANYYSKHQSEGPCTYSATTFSSATSAIFSSTTQTSSLPPSHFPDHYKKPGPVELVRRLKVGTHVSIRTKKDHDGSDMYYCQGETGVIIEVDTNVAQCYKVQFTDDIRFGSRICILTNNELYGQKGKVIGVYNDMLTVQLNYNSVLEVSPMAVEPETYWYAQDEVSICRPIQFT